MVDVSLLAIRPQLLDVLIVNDFAGTLERTHHEVSLGQLSLFTRLLCDLNQFLVAAIEGGHRLYFDFRLWDLYLGGLGGKGLLLGVVKGEQSLVLGVLVGEQL